MKYRITFFTLAFIVSTAKAIASPVPDFTCDVPAGTILERDGYSLGQVLHVYGEKLALETYGEPSDQLDLTDSHGAINYYSKGNVRVAVMPDSAQIELPDQIITCAKFTDASIEHEIADLSTKGQLGASYGSTVRSSPVVADNKIDKLPEGEPIFLIKNAGNRYQDHDWFEVEYSEGLTGFVWGGTLCSNDLWVRGVANQCGN